VAAFDVTADVLAKNSKLPKTKLENRDFDIFASLIGTAHSAHCRFECSL
jgi:hypothetical protein